MEPIFQIKSHSNKFSSEISQKQFVKKNLFF
jgi:hypothetical protein